MHITSISQDFSQSSHIPHSPYSDLLLAIDNRELTDAITILEGCGYTDDSLVHFLLAATQHSAGGSDDE